MGIRPHAESRKDSGGAGGGPGAAGAACAALGAPARVAERARVVLVAADGLTGPRIAERSGVASRRSSGGSRWTRPNPEVESSNYVRRSDRRCQAVVTI